MKKVFILLVVLVGMTGAKAQWFQQNSGTTNSLYTGYFLDENAGYVVGDLGTILKTIDGGDNWEIKNSGTTKAIGSIFFVNQFTGYAVGASGTILKTTDGGENWTPKVSGTTTNLLSVYFPEENIGYIVGGGMVIPGLILKTTDGGENWTSQSWGTNTTLMSVCFINPDIGYAVGRSGFMSSQGIILRTANGGTDWESVFSCGVEYGNLWSICFTDINNGFATGQNEGSGYLVKTSDGGLTWTGNYIELAQALFFGYFPNAVIGYAVGWDNDLNNLILKTIDGGANWTAQNSGINPDLILFSIYFINENIGYTLGTEGTILKTTNGGTIGLNEGVALSQKLKISPNPANDNITISSPALTGIFNLSIFNVRAEKVMERQLLNIETQIDIIALPRGVYFVRLQNEKIVEVGKFIKK